MSKDLDGKVIVITGAGGGIGEAAAEICAAQGARLVLAGRTLDKVETVADRIARSGAECIALQADVARGDDVRKLTETAVGEFGRLDGAFNNAGIDGALAPAADYPEDEFDTVIAVNLKGVWQCMRFQIPAMLESGGGSIVNNASALGEVGQFAMAAYCASKAGVLGLTKAAALDYGAQGVRVNAISPGVIETPMMTSQMDAMPELREILLARHPIGRLGEPVEIAGAVAWMLSDASSFLLGSNVAVDGGYAAI
ncbi:glucose 1-dehydrogenase [Parasphingopyxis algicola]|uniref:SDR family NAD(P)-dependent oxidoreductase n=1 Tax=Parasphingopyxis algicola TaxID=2026624 RepID=UPI0015A275A2|nr:glucose 1-dehydrogenase [Parasphingopyxis algicola]QLC26499.1 glucose 1-dehydrogenase [Parasphingopyxis algicola]